MDWTALVGGERISAGLKPFGSRVCLLSLLSFSLFFFPPSFPSATPPLLRTRRSTPLRTCFISPFRDSYMGRLAQG
jgi:hypothetical protein